MTEATSKAPLETPFRGRPSTLPATFEGLGNVPELNMYKYGHTRQTSQTGSDVRFRRSRGSATDVTFFGQRLLTLTTLGARKSNDTEGYTLGGNDFRALVPGILTHFFS